jgi:hypothetical protein
MLVGNTAYDPNDFKLISTQVLTANTLNVTFSSIPQTYKHLQLRALGKSPTTRDDIFVKTNVSGTYYTHALFGTGSSTSSTYRGASTSGFRLSDGGAQSTIANAFSGIIIDILDYTNTTKNKTMQAFYGRAETENIICLASGFVADTSAVTSLNIELTTNGFVTGSRFSLYGIRG